MAIYLNNNGTADRYDGAGSGGGSDFDLPYYETQAEADQAIEDHEIEVGDYYAVGEEYPDTVISAEEVNYDNDDSGLTATDVQGAITQLSEKVYDFEERTFTTAAECFAFLGSLPKKVLKDVTVSNFTARSSTWKTMTRDSTGASTVTTSTYGGGTYSGNFYRLKSSFNSTYSFNDNFVTVVENASVDRLRNIIVQENGISYNVTDVMTDFTANNEIVTSVLADISSITLYVPVAVADD